MSSSSSSSSSSYQEEEKKHEPVESFDSLTFGNIGPSGEPTGINSSIKIPLGMFTYGALQLQERLAKREDERLAAFAETLKEFEKLEQKQEKRQQQQKKEVRNVKVGDPAYTLPDAPVRILGITGTPVCKSTFTSPKKDLVCYIGGCGFPSLIVEIDNDGNIYEFKSSGLECHNVKDIDFEILN